MCLRPNLASCHLPVLAMDSWLKAAREQAAKIGPLMKLVCGNHWEKSRNQEVAEVARTCRTTGSLTINKYLVCDLSLLAA